MSIRSPSVAAPLVPDEFELIRAPILADLAELDRRVEIRLFSDVPLVNRIGAHIIGGGGKRFRPLLLMLVARCLGYEGSDHIELAMVVEFIHTATLLHDDVVDQAEIRRGLRAAHRLWGNEASILVGDFLYSRAFQIMAALGRFEVMDIMAEATNVIASGEVMQLMYCHDPATTEARYLEVVRRKTATLFSAASELGALAAGAEDARAQWAQFGHHLGMAFQLIDDVLDYSAPAERLGKNVGVDLAEGKPTLPLIRALAVSTGARLRDVEEAVRSRGERHLESVLGAIRDTDALDYTRNRARREAHLALDLMAPFSASVFGSALVQLVEFSIRRAF